MAAVAVRISIGSYEMFTIFCDWNMRSWTVITETSADDFTITVNWFTMDGAELRSTCGRMIRRNTSTGDMPTEKAASRWPRGTASIPPRNVSARYPLDCTASAHQAASKKVLGQPNTSGHAYATHSNCTMIGVARKNSISTVAIGRRGRTYMRSRQSSSPPMIAHRKEMRHTSIVTCKPASNASRWFQTSRCQLFMCRLGSRDDAGTPAIGEHTQARAADQHD